MNFVNDLKDTITKLAAKGKGILAADESGTTIGKRFNALNFESNLESRKAYRDLLITAPDINQYIAGIILFEETLEQEGLDGTLFTTKLKQLGILPGIKVDKGLVALPNTADEQITQGLDGLGERLAEYKKLGACFAKWRAVYQITTTTPSTLAIKTNAECLARYAALCQVNGIVPIVEPEILLENDQPIERCAAVTDQVLHALFNSLNRHKVALEYIILKPSMVISGKNCPTQASTEEVALATVTALLRNVPACVPTINFLSGGQTSEQATAHLNAMHNLGKNLPWNLSYSYARALQDDAMKTWSGKSQNVAAAQQAFCRRAKLNSLAAQGQYDAKMEKEISVA
jgi:fructose-bisphosphate aldolase class I